MTSTTDQAIIPDDGGDPMDCDCCEAFATVQEGFGLFCAEHYADHLMRLEIQDQADAMTDWLSDMLDARYHAHQEEVAA